MRRSIVADLAIFALAILVGPSAIANLAQAQTAARAVAVWYVDHNGYMVRVQPRE